APTVVEWLECAEEDYYLGSFDLVPFHTNRSDDQINLYVQAHPGKIEDLPGGMYQYSDAGLEKIADDLIMMKHVIAINQGVYENSSFGIAMVRIGHLDWDHYISLGRRLQQLQQNGLNIGLMSSGYTSKSGNALPSAKRMAQILAASGRALTSFYYCIGGLISDEQRLSEGMKEDTIHMKGPVEMIKEDLANSLPSYMVPNKIVQFDAMPLTPNGKIDQKALLSSDAVNMEIYERPYIAARTLTEERLVGIWQKVMKQELISAQANFFELGGNSLMAVAIVNMVNKTFEISLPLQVIFEAPTIEELARTINSIDEANICRLIKLSDRGRQQPVYCWPGLGGYPMNLRALAGAIHGECSLYGVQAYGINPGEMPYPTVMQMASIDINEIKRIQPTGPYTLWGYSFGAQVAFEAAYQLEQQGERVESLFLIAPGSPKLHAQAETESGTESGYRNKAFVTILYSVFAQSVSGPELEQCLKHCTDEAHFIDFICAHHKQLDCGLVKRIVDIVTLTYGFKYTFNELRERRITAPITLFKAQGDDYSCLENRDGYSTTALEVVELDSDHYTLLKEAGVRNLVDNIERIREHRINKAIPHSHVSMVPRSAIN
ncbi:MAG: thioesterase domain-containing protein, partial [Pseudomonadota bacterium]|nr:thioesterase domain-containing protein [Pseudomonadota bacterium]